MASRYSEAKGISCTLLFKNRPAFFSLNTELLEPVAHARTSQTRERDAFVRKHHTYPNQQCVCLKNVIFLRRESTTCLSTDTTRLLMCELSFTFWKAMSEGYIYYCSVGMAGRIPGMHRHPITIVAAVGSKNDRHVGRI